jgi:CubicO group peptidase (beta-lactamase class C family)
MLVDDTTGWSEEGPIEPDPVVTDFQRAWTLREGVELRATTMTALAEPGTRTNDAQTNAAVLGLVVEDVGGRPLAELVGDMLETAGLSQTGLLDGRTIPDRYRHGVFAFNGALADTSAFGGTSFLTWNHATTSAVSTPTDLLDLLDLWETGALFTTDRTSAPERYAPEPTGRTDFVPGVGVPFNGFCPCTAVDGGIEPVAIGRAPATVGTKSYLWRYTDGISIVFNVNSNVPADTAEVDAVMTTLHDIAAQAGS